MKDIKCLSHHVWGKFVMAANKLILLEIVYDQIHFLQIFADTMMNGMDCNQCFLCGYNNGWACLVIPIK